MKAAVITAPETCEIREVDLRDPEPGEVRFRVTGCGVCGSDLPVWEGRPWFEYPREPGAPGHESWGVVDAVGRGVQGVREGDRVASISFHAYAEYDFARANTVVKLGAENAQYPFPGEPLGCAANAMARSDVRPGHSVAVVGAGFLGCLLGGMCASSGAKVFAVSRRQFALDTAVRMGASETFLLADGKQVIDRVFELTGGRGCDRVIEAAGAQETLDLAGGLTCIRGRLIIAGYHQEGSRSVDMQMWNWRGIDVINAHERDELMYAEGIRRAVSLIGAGLLDPRILFTHSFSLENLAGAFRAMKERPAGFMKALIYPEDPAPSGGGH